MIRNRRGYTILEIMTVFAILIIVSYFVMSSLPFLREKTRDRRRRYDLAVLRHVIELVKVETGEYPKTCTTNPPDVYYATNNQGLALSGMTADVQVHNPYVPGIVPTFYENLPVDPNPGPAVDPACIGSHKDIGYVSNGENYKVIYYCANEGGPILDTDPLADQKTCLDGECYAWAVSNDATYTHDW